MDISEIDLEIPENPSTVGTMKIQTQKTLTEENELEMRLDMKSAIKMSTIKCRPLDGIGGPDRDWYD